MLWPLTQSYKELFMNTMTAEELELCLLYSETEKWERLLTSQGAQGRSRFRGPPGLRAKAVSRLSSFTARDLLSLHLDMLISHEGRWLDSGAFLTSEGDPLPTLHQLTLSQRD